MNKEIFQKKLKKAINEQVIEKGHEEYEKVRNDFKLMNREATFVLAAMLNGVKLPSEIKEQYWSITKYQGYVDNMEKKIVKALKLDKEVLQYDRSIIKEVKDLGLNVFSLEGLLLFRYSQNNMEQISDEEFEEAIEKLRVEASDPHSTISTWAYLISLLSKENNLHKLKH